MVKNIVSIGLCLLFGSAGNLHAQKQGNVLAGLRLGLLNYDIGAEIKVGSKHSIYPSVGFGHTLVYFNDRYFIYARPDDDIWLNFGYMSMTLGMEYRYYPSGASPAKAGPLNKGFFTGIKMKYTLQQGLLLDRGRYNFQPNLKIGTGIGYQDKMGKNGNWGYELIAYPGIIINNDFTYVEFNSFCSIKLLIPLYRSTHS